VVTVRTYIFTGKIIILENVKFYYLETLSRLNKMFKCVTFKR